MAATPLVRVALRAHGLLFLFLFVFLFLFYLEGRKKLIRMGLARGRMSATSPLRIRCVSATYPLRISYVSAAYPLRTRCVSAAYPLRISCVSATYPLRIRYVSPKKLRLTQKSVSQAHLYQIHMKHMSCAEK